MFSLSKLKDDMVLNFFLNKYLIFPIILGLLILIFLSFVHFLGGYNFLYGDRSAISIFIGGASTFLAVLFGGSYWLQKRSEAAMKLLSLFSLHITNMIEIMHQPTIYQYDGYYPFAHPEKRELYTKGSWERPCRLIYNEFGVLKKGLVIYSSFLRGDNFARVHELEQKIECIIVEINNWLSVKLAHEQEQEPLVHDYDNFNRYHQELIDIYAEVRQFLLPFI